MTSENSKENSLIRDFIENNNQKSFEKLYNMHFNYVYNFVFSRVGNRTWTEDIVSETFMTLVEVKSSFNYKSKFRSFMVGIAINKIRQFWTKQYKQNESEIDENFIIIEEEDPERLIESEDRLSKLLTKLNRVLNELDIKYRQVLDARFIEKLSVKDTALKLNLSVSNVKIRQKRGLEKAALLADTLFNKKEDNL